MKKILLFLLILLSIASVNATAPTMPVNYTTSEYKVVLDEQMTTEQTTSTLSVFDYVQYAPVVSGINGSTIYFESEKDLARFCMHFTQSNKNYAFNHEYSVFISDNPVPVSIVYGETYSCGNGARHVLVNVNSSKIQTAYVFGAAYCGGSGVSSNMVLNGKTVTSRGSHGMTYGFIDSPFYKSSNVFDLYASSSSSTGAGVDGSFLVFDSITYTATMPEPSVTQDTCTPYVIIPQMNVIINSIPAVSVYEGDSLLGTTDNGGYLKINLPIGEHSFKFIKEGYWDYTINLNVQNDTTINPELAPKTSLFHISKQFEENIYPNSISKVKLDLEPIKNAYSTRLRVSGADVTKVYYNTQILPKTTDGSYILGDISNPQSLEIEYKTPSSWGQRTFTVELTATDLEGSAYTNLETINYEVLELPFLLEMPTFAIGNNNVKITDQSGSTYSVLLSLYNSEGSEVWSSSNNIIEYCDCSFEVPITEPGNYILELTAKAGTVKSYYSIEIIEPVKLITNKLSSNLGKVTTAKFAIYNPTDNVKYYYSTLECQFFNESINKTFSIAPGVNKTVELPFKVPDKLDLENYQLNLKIYDNEKSEPICSEDIILTISKNSFLPINMDSNNYLIILGILIIIIGAVIIYWKWGKK
ncbi:hypothetical protein [Methanococcus voltae]|uniref:PEGA domain-containing protein n=1 Tax=Methanococcus voltae (strain ATCC BAA-1334 / A3) TaxID=456320 RepID=D7DQP6_METV3|nr:hypothetical protein [Methanococcus voltae]MCS3900833.1 hypothetical protein [Methanococcus voltae]